MSTSTIPLHRSASGGYILDWLINQVLSWVRVEVQRRRKYVHDPKRNPAEAFADFLEGYADGFDPYPVCGRYVVRKDLHAILDEFATIVRNFSLSTAQIAASPDELTKRLGANRNVAEEAYEAAKRALERVEERRSHEAGPGERSEPGITSSRDS